MPRLSHVTTSERSSVSARSTSAADEPGRARPDRQPEAARVLALDREQPLGHGDRVARRLAREQLRGETLRDGQRALQATSF